MTKRNELLTAFVSAAEGATNVTVWRSKVTPVQPPGPGVIIAPVKEDVVLPKVNTEVERTLRVGITVVCYGNAPEEQAEPVLASIHAAVMADQTLGGRALRILEDGTTWTIANADKGPAAEVVATYAISYRTRSSVLT